MADAADIIRVRRLINDPEHEELTDEDIAAILDGVEGNINAAVAEAWGVKAAHYSTLVNVSESGSTRNLGDLYKNAMAMQSYYSVAGIQVSAGRTRIGKIVRSD